MTILLSFVFLLKFSPCRHNVHPTLWSEPQPVHICCLIDPKRPRPLVDPSSEDKAYVCSDIINARAEKTMADEFSGSQAHWTTERKTPVSWKVFGQLREHTLAKHGSKMWSAGDRVSGLASETVAGREGAVLDHHVVTLNVYMKLCVWRRRSEGSAPCRRKMLCFYTAAWNVWRTVDICFISICDSTPSN